MTEEFDLMEEIEHEAQDEEILNAIEAKKRAAKKSFSSIVNKKKLSKYELEEVMVWFLIYNSNILFILVITTNSTTKTIWWTKLKNLP